MRQGTVFALIGVTATLVHVVIALLARSLGGASPMLANFAGYSAAVVVSFVGNARLTFDGTLTAGPFVRFLAVSLTGLAANQAITWLLTERLGWPFVAALAVVVVVVPGFTFVMSKLWVFRAPADSSRD
jgi:putative flippase GtrA